MRVHSNVLATLATLVVATLVGVPCLAATHTLSGTMDVFQAGTNDGFGVGTGNGMGTISGTYDADTNTVNYSLTWEGLSNEVSNMHFHLGEAGVSGGVELAVPSPWTSPQVGTSVIDDTKEANLLGGLWYLNVHTGTFPGGEIRGQVLVSRIPEPSSLCLSLVGLLAVGLRRR